MTMKQAEKTIKPTDKTETPIDEIVEYFEMMHKSQYNYGDSRQDYYCGITNNIKSNLLRHNIDGYDACVECGTYEKASQVEKELGEYGFDIGSPNNPAGNGGAEDSTIVYMVRKRGQFVR